MKYLLSSVAIVAALALAAPVWAQGYGPGPGARTGTGPGVTPPGGGSVPPRRCKIYRRGRYRGTRPRRRERIIQRGRLLGWLLDLGLQHRRSRRRPGMRGLQRTTMEWRHILRRR